jgi:hypothetical protein
MSTSRRGRHDRSNGAIAQSHDARDHRALARLNNASGFRLRHQASDLFVADSVLGLCLVSECPENCASGHIQERDNRRSNRGHGRHGRRHPDGDFFRIAQRNLLRHELADHQGKVGNDGNDKTNADCLGNTGAYAQVDEPFGQSQSNGGSREGAG